MCPSLCTLCPSSALPQKRQTANKYLEKKVNPKEKKRKPNDGDMAQAAQDEERRRHEFERAILEWGSRFTRSSWRPTSAGWIVTAVNAVRTACAYPARTSQQGPSYFANMRNHMLESVGIRPDSGARSCSAAVDDLADLWETLVDDVDAHEAALAYLYDWPPTAESLASLAVDMALPPSAPPGEREYAVLSGIMAPHEAIVRTLGNAARTGQRTRAMSEALRFGGACVDARAQYLVMRAGPDVRDVAILVSVAYGDAAKGAGTVIGRMHSAGVEASLDDMPSPAPDALPPRIRPYAAFIPALLATVLNVGTTDEHGTPSWDPDYWRRSPLGVVRSYMKPLVSFNAISPQLVLAHFPDGPMSLRGARYAWLTECALEHLLTLGLGEHAASVALVTPTVYERAAPADLTVGASFGREDKRRDARPPSSTVQPPSLGARAVDAIVRAGSRVPLELLPAEVADPLAYGIWRAECASTAVNDADQFISSPTRDRLLDVSRYWGVEPTAEQVGYPHLLCGELAPGAIANGMVGGSRFLRERVTRTGPPMLTSPEQVAIDSICAAPKGMRFMREPDPVVLIDGVLASDVWLNEIANEDALFEERIIGRARRLIAQANEMYNVERDESPRAPPLDAQGLPASAQALAAITALRSGLDVTVDDLADAGSVCALLAPLDALFP